MPGKGGRASVRVLNLSKQCCEAEHPVEGQLDDSLCLFVSSVLQAAFPTCRLQLVFRPGAGQP